MFHTGDDVPARTENGARVVVIPWRGFRCFTLEERHRRASLRLHLVVIPWRGFRCFTHTRLRKVSTDFAAIRL